MKKIIVFILSAFIMLSLLDCSKKEKTFTVVTKNGVKHVHNIKPEFGKKQRVILEFIREIGEKVEGNENYVLYNIRDVLRDGNGNIYVLLTSECQILKLNSKGELSKVFGGKGQGPGEFTAPICINIDRKGNIYTADFLSHNITILDSSGKQIKRFLLPDIHRGFWSVQPFRLVENNKLVMGGMANFRIPVQYQYKRTKIFRVFNLEGSQINEFGDMISVKSEKFTLYSGKASFDVEGNSIVIVYNHLNKIEKRNSDGKALFVSDRELNVKFDDVREVLKNRKSPKIINKDMGIDGNGRIWICTITKKLEESEKKTVYDDKTDHLVFDIFSRNGILLQKLPVPVNFSCMRIFDNYVYFISRDRSKIYVYKIIKL